MERNKSAIIIGAGLGGLECGYILAKKGLEVTVVEHNSQIGGCLQSFKRGDGIFDTGFHYVGGLGEGESLYPLFRYFNLLHLPWYQLNKDCFDQVYIGKRAYPIASGYRNFTLRLAEYFPKETQNLRKYTQLLKNVGDHIYDAFDPKDQNGFYSTSLFAQSAQAYLNETIGDPQLRKVLAGSSLKMELRPALPLYIFAQINNSFIQSAWRLSGGGSLVAESLAEDIRRMGGRIITDATVTSMTEQDGRIARVTVNGKDDYSADWVISSAHPAVTLDLVKESTRIRKIYRKRISSLPNTAGMFTANIRLKPQTVRYLNRNIYLHREDADLWNPQGNRLESMLASFCAAERNGTWAGSLDLLTPMSWEEVSAWAGTPIGRRGEDYVAFKKRKTQECLNYAAEFIPCLQGAVEKAYTSTPLTYRDYTLTPEGTAYGLRKDYENVMGTVLAPRTPVENLLLTGQNLNLHGVLGVSMTSVMTCAAILGMDTVKAEIFGNR